jgi:DNA-binding NtrC family response regulator
MRQTGRQLRVFVVDDHDVIASSLAMILRFQGGFHATSFTDSVEALRASELEAPDLLITDVIMPRLSGIDLAMQLVRRCEHCKVLLFSGQMVSAETLGPARADGYNFEVLIKPVHPATLLSTIQRVIEDAPSPVSVRESPGASVEATGLSAPSPMPALG